MKGLTLMEVLVTMGIAILVGALLLIIITNSAGMYYKQSSKLQGGLNINDSLSQIRANIKQANAVAASYTGAGTTYTSGVSQLVLKIPSQDASGNIIPSVYDYFIYFGDPPFLRFKSFPDQASFRKSSDQILTGSLNSILFQYFDTAAPPNEVVPPTGKKVKVTVTLKQKSGADYEINTATSEANLRND